MPTNPNRAHFNTTVTPDAIIISYGGYPLFDVNDWNHLQEIADVLTELAHKGRQDHPHR